MATRQALFVLASGLGLPYGLNHEDALHSYV